MTTSFPFGCTTTAASRNDPAETAIAARIPVEALPASRVPISATPIAPPVCRAALRTPAAMPARHGGAASMIAAVAAGIVNAIPTPAATSGTASSQ